MPRIAVAAVRGSRTRVAQSRVEARSAATATDSKPVSGITEEAVKKVWQLIRQHNITVVDLKFN
ncbi:MAG: hypothetical protein HYW10_01145, partial [Candidatus Omnitrophica bacterium]|nr:hypothetical protein [Candidatus Omnitrophota bacterium]